MVKPIVFIGSSSESLEVARCIQIQLKDIATTKIWTENIFKPGEFTLDTLIRTSKEVDFAILIASSDDKVTVRDNNYFSPRDNVIFELGLFIGQITSKRTFVVAENIDNLKLPNDISGLNVLSYDGSISEEHIVSELGPTCTIIRSQIKKLGPLSTDKLIDVISSLRRTDELENILTTQLVPFIKMNDWDEIYKRAVTLVSKAERRVYATSFSPDIWHGNNRYLEAIAARAAEQKKRNVELVHKVVFGSLASQEVLKENIDNRRKVFKKYGVERLLKFRKSNGDWGVDILIVDDLNIHLSFQSYALRHLFIGIEIKNAPDLVGPIASWYEEFIFEKADDID